MAWTDEIVEQLKQHWIDGKSASQIAGLLGNGVTRNAVIGKVHRLGFAGRAKAPSARKSRPRRSRPRPHTASRGRASVPTRPAWCMGRPRSPSRRRRCLGLRRPEEFESVVVPVSERVDRGIAGVDVPLAARRPDDLGIPLLRSPTASGPYCGYHGGLAYQPHPGRRRDRDRARRTLLR